MDYSIHMVVVFHFSKDFIYLLIFRERGRTGERVGEIHRSIASHAPLTGDLARNPGTSPDWEPNQ